MVRRLSVIAFCLFAFAALSEPASAQQTDVRVWVNTSSDIYHCPGTRWYGKTKRGEYMPQSRALREGIRPANRQRCGPSTSRIQREEIPADDVRVWVNTGSGVYHCPRTRWYGKTKRGQYMRQEDALERRYRPAGGVTCRAG